MAGRGRGATLPSWMTAADVPGPDAGPMQGSLPVATTDAAVEEIKRASKRSRSRSRDREDRHRDRDRRGDRDRERDRDRDRHREKERSQERSSKWRSRKERNCPSNFDVRPPHGIELPPIGVNTPINGIPNAFLSFSNNPLDMLKEPTAAPPEIQQRLMQQGLSRTADVSAHTRHARRLYAGGIPTSVTEGEIRIFFNEVISRALAPNRMDGQPVLGVYLNLEKCYAFIELPSVELTTACMQLDGLRWEHYSGPCVLRIRRPNDYRPELVAAGPPPQLDMDYLTRMGVSSPDGPGKIFVGGLPYNLPDEDLKELLGAFGQLKSFHQVREGGIGSLSKGYGFCEYFTKEASDNAVNGLNGLQLGDKTLTVRYATGSTNVPMIPPGQSLAAQLGVNFNSVPSAPAVPAITYPSLLASTPTRVLKLSNMVSANDLANDGEVEDIKEDVRLECSDHGQVLSVIIPRVKDGFPSISEGHIFVEFAAASAARDAALALNGRKFDNKTVIVQFYDENSYANLNFY